MGRKEFSDVRYAAPKRASNRIATGPKRAEPAEPAKSALPSERGAERDPAVDAGHRRAGAKLAGDRSVDHADFADGLMATSPPVPGLPPDKPGEVPPLPDEPERPVQPDPVAG